MPSTQKKIRDLERTIQKKGSTPDLQKRLKELQNEKDGKNLKEKEKKNSEKYHMVIRFMARTFLDVISILFSDYNLGKVCGASKSCS